MEVDTIAVPAASAAAGGISVVWFTKLLISSWLQKYEKALAEITQLSKDMAVTLHRLGTIEKDLNGLGQSIRASLSKSRE